MIGPMIGWVLLAAVAAASPVEDLAFDLGRAHALRQLCEGGTDGYWRDRMAALIDAEGVGAARKEALTLRFNAGFADAGASFKTCDAKAKGALRETAAKGAAIAHALADAKPPGSP